MKPKANQDYPHDYYEESFLTFPARKEGDHLIFDPRGDLLVELSKNTVSIEGGGYFCTSLYVGRWTEESEGNPVKLYRGHQIGVPWDPSSNEAHFAGLVWEPTPPFPEGI